MISVAVVYSYASGMPFAIPLNDFENKFTDVLLKYGGT